MKKLLDAEGISVIHFDKVEPNPSVEIVEQGFAMLKEQPADFVLAVGGDVYKRQVYRSFVGDYVTSLEMSGAALTVMRMKEEFKELLDFPVDTPAITIK